MAYNAQAQTRCKSQARDEKGGAETLNRNLLLTIMLPCVLRVGAEWYDLDSSFSITLKIHPSHSVASHCGSTRLLTCQCRSSTYDFTGAVEAAIKS